MERQPVVSTNVAQLGYDPDSQTLEVEFQSDAVYQYYNVSQSVYESFARAPSKGQFLNYQIKNAYPYARVG